MTDPIDPPRPHTPPTRPTPPDAQAADDGSVAVPGRRIVAASWAGTAALGATTALAVTVKAVQPLAIATALALFAAGTVAFFAAFLKAVDRSRTEEIGVMNLFFLDHSAPTPVKRSLLASLVVHMAIAITAAALRPNTAIAFAVLAPIYGLALAGLWAARHGTFPARANQPKK